MEYLRILLAIGLLASTGCIVAPRIPTTAVTISAGIGDVANGGDYYAYTIQPQRGVALNTICMPLPTFPVGVTTEGEAFVDFEIDAAGKPKDICVVKSSLVEFGRASVEAIEKWEFQPRRRAFASKATRVHCEFKFMHEPTGQPMHDEDQRAKMKEYARWSSFSAANPLLFQE